jgi:hypothetical protein
VDVDEAGRRRVSQERSLFQESWGWLSVLIVVCCLALAQHWRWDFEFFAPAVAGIVLGACATLLPCLWAQQEAEWLVRYCQRRHHESKRKGRGAKQGGLSA